MFGTTNALVPELSRRNGRLALPAMQVLGGATVWRHESAEPLTLGASVGEPGRFEGFPQSRFVKRGGWVSSAFVQSNYGPWTGAVAIAQGRNILPEIAVVSESNTPSDVLRIDARGIYSSVQYQGPLVRTGRPVSWVPSIQVSMPQASGPTPPGATAGRPSRLPCSALRAVLHGLIGRCRPIFRGRLPLRLSLAAMGCIGQC